MLLPLLFPLLFANMTAFGEVHIEEKTVHQNEYGNIACSCVDYTRQFRPDIPSQDAGQFIPATTTPHIGSVAVMRYHSGARHVAYVSDVRNGQVLLLHANVEPCKESSEWRYANDWRILGYL